MSDRRRPGTWLLRTLLGVVLVGCLAAGWLGLRSSSGIGSWRLRLTAAKLLSTIRPASLPRPLRVLSPPDSEYAGVWSVSPEQARRQLFDRYGFSQLARAYLHAYDIEGETTYEVASCAYRPEGFFGAWQLHVRLFPRPDGHTDVWCHWERNPTVAPIAHLRKDGYDPDAGKRRLEALLGDALTPADQR